MSAEAQCKQARRRQWRIALASTQRIFKGPGANHAWSGPRKRSLKPSRDFGIAERGSEKIPGAGRRDRTDQQRSGGNVVGALMTNCKVLRMNCWAGTIAGPRSHSSMISWSVSSRTLLIRVFHDVKRDKAARPTGRAMYDQPIDGRPCPTIAECMQSTESRSLRDPRDEPPSRIQVGSTNNANRARTIP
jgi:hypothetical protein